jgi:ribonucleoside-diphosphate reductase alpha chain
MPIDQVVHMISGLQMDSDSINNWTTGVARVLKRYIPGAVAEDDLTFLQ